MFVLVRFFKLQIKPNKGLFDFEVLMFFILKIKENIAVFYRE